MRSTNKSVSYFTIVVKNLSRFVNTNVNYMKRKRTSLPDIGDGSPLLDALHTSRHARLRDNLSDDQTRHLNRN